MALEGVAPVHLKILVTPSSCNKHTSRPVGDYSLVHVINLVDRERT